MTMSPFYPCGKPRSTGTHNETVKKLALFSAVINGIVMESQLRISISCVGVPNNSIKSRSTPTSISIRRHEVGITPLFLENVFSQALRYRRVITKDDNLIQNLQKLRDQLLQRGYKFSEINSQFNKVLHYSQKQLLINKKQQQQHSNILPFVVPFDKTTQSISSILKRHWHFINNEPRLKELWPATPILSLKKHPSLGDILVRADLPKTKQ